MRIPVTILLLFLFAQPVQAGTVVVDSAAAGSGLRVETESYRERRFRGIIQQGRDFSCGSAALATMLNFYYEWPTSEQEILESMYIHGDQERIHKEGFSLLDMKNYLASIGMPADGYRLPLDKLNAVKVPAIVLLDIDGYLHFVVVQGVRDDTVLVGDPALGRKIIPRKEFEEMWNGIMFVIRGQYDIARRHFDRPEDWETTEKADSALARSSFNRSISDITMQMNPTTTFYFR